MHDFLCSMFWFYLGGASICAISTVAMTVWALCKKELWPEELPLWCGLMLLITVLWPLWVVYLVWDGLFGKD